MQGPYTLSETVATKREFLFYLVHPTTKDPVTTEGGQQPQIRKPGEITWTNTEETLIHVGNGHYVLVLTSTELNTLGMFSIRYARASFAFEFEDVGKIETSGDTSNESIIQLIRQVLTRVKYLEFVAKTGDQNITQQDELLIL